MNTTTTDREKARYIDAFATANTAAEISTVHRDLWAGAVDTYGDVLSVPADVRDAISEGYRLAHVRLIDWREGRRSSDGTPRQKRQAVEHVAPPADGDKDWTIVCPECGDEKPARKFATVTGKPGYRENTCRDCKAARRNGDGE